MPLANFANSFASVFDTGGKFAAGVTDAGGKLPPISMSPVANFATSLLVLLIPVANLPPVSMTPLTNNVTNYQTADNLK